MAVAQALREARPEVALGEGLGLCDPVVLASRVVARGEKLMEGVVVRDGVPVLHCEWLPEARSEGETEGLRDLVAGAVVAPAVGLRLAQAEGEGEALEKTDWLGVLVRMAVGLLEREAVAQREGVTVAEVEREMEPLAVGVQVGTQATVSPQYL